MLPIKFITLKNIIKINQFVALDIECTQFGQSNGGHSNNRDFPRGQLTDFEHFIKNYERVKTTWTNLETF
jgi:hypothetical protein